MTSPRGTSVPDTALVLPPQNSVASRLLALGIVMTGLAFALSHRPPHSVSVMDSGAVAAAKTVAATPVVPQRISGPSVFAQEAAMDNAALMARWDPLIAQASKRVGVPADWIRAVMRQESGGRTVLGENQKIISSAGAMGIMQVMPQTYAEMREQYHLGADPYDPHDNVIAGAAYLKWLHGKYGYPAMFAAYNDGPGEWENHIFKGRELPAETQAYAQSIARMLHDPSAQLPAMKPATLTRPDGSEIAFDAAKVTAVRTPVPGEYAPDVRAVISLGRVQQGVREDVAAAAALLRQHGARI